MIPVEHERRWLVRLGDVPVDVLAAPKEHITQGYLSPAGVKPIVRVRVLRSDASGTPRRGVQTVKNPRAEGGGCSEIEFDIPVHKAQDLMSIRLGGLEKTRHTQAFEHGLSIELDLFDGALTGLVIAEIELPWLEYPINVPSWFGPEITGVEALSNVGMAFYPDIAIETAQTAWFEFNQKHPRQELTN